LNNQIIDILMDVKNQYGDMIFYNHQKTKNLMSDLAPGLHKERIHITQFLELNGYFQLKYAEHSYPIVRTRLIRNYVNTYAVNESVAVWVLDVFSYILGYTDFKNINKIIKTPDDPFTMPVVTAEPELADPGLTDPLLTDPLSEVREVYEKRIEKTEKTEETEKVVENSDKALNQPSNIPKKIRERPVSKTEPSKKNPKVSIKKPRDHDKITSTQTPHT